MKRKLVYLSAVSVLPERKIDRPVVFLAEPYVTESVKLQLEAVGYEIMPKIWTNKYRLKAAHDYLERTYMDFKEKIGSALSQIHNVGYPAFFWEIPMASWLLHYLHALYDRYSRLKRAIELYGNENVILFACQYDIKTPKTFSDFIENTAVIEQSVSAFYGAVAKELSIPVLEFNSTKGCYGRSFLQGKRIDFFSKSFYWKACNKLIDEFSKPILSNLLKGKDVLMSQNKFNTREKLVFSRKLNASFFPKNKKNIRTTLQKVDRKALLSITATDEFEKVAINLLPQFMPTYLLEEFKSYRDQAADWDSFRVYFSADDWQTNILFCYAVSLGRLKGAKIVGGQHGGGFGQYKRIHPEFTQRKFCDFYITWGWRDKHYSGAQLLPLPQPEISHYLNKHKPINETALWAGTTMPRQLVRFMNHISDNLSKYIRCKKLFISHLERDIYRNLVYRPHLIDHGWSYNEKEIFEKYPDVKIERVGRLCELLQKVKLYICDHQSTSFMEALVTNTPTILFWDIELKDERESATQYFDLLRDAGILFHDPIKAAEQVNAIWDDVQGWWLHSSRQNARLEFMDAFCLANRNWQKKWIESFRKILEKRECI